MQQSVHPWRLAALAGVFAFAGAAAADVTPIDPFTGDAIETFEAIGPPAPYDGPMPIFGGGATMDDNFTDPWIVTSLSDPDNTLFPFDGNFMGLTPTGWTVFEFQTPVTRFGGYFGHLTLELAAGDVTFYDGDGAVIDSVDHDVPYNEWTWRGWESDEPISRIEFHTGANPGVPSVFDNLQVAYVPAPGALALLAIGAIRSRRRRR